MAFDINSIIAALYKRYAHLCPGISMIHSVRCLCRVVLIDGVNLKMRQAPALVMVRSRVNFCAVQGIAVSLLHKRFKQARQNMCGLVDFVRVVSVADKVGFKRLPVGRDSPSCRVVCQLAPPAVRGSMGPDVLAVQVPQDFTVHVRGQGVEKRKVPRGESGSSYGVCSAMLVSPVGACS